jgi:lysophospholipid acyltransferase (LPLAT)-like uncharacterized protein
MRVEVGVIQLARMKSAPLIGFAWSIKGSKVARSWDRQIVPPPFSRGAYVWTKPFRIAKDATPEEVEAVRLAFEQEMIRISQEADRRAEMEIVEPADPAEPVKPSKPALKEAS